MNSLLLAIDQLDPRLLQRCVDGGGMPTVASLLQRGCSGQVHASEPQTAPLWTTVATGRPSAQHGVLDDLTVGPGGHAARAAAWRDWRAPPFWHALADTTALINWPASTSAAWGTAVSDDMPGAAAWVLSPQAAQGSHPVDAWGLDPDAVWPAAQRDAVRALRVHPSDVAPAWVAELMRGLGPTAHTPELQQACRQLIAALATWQALALNAIDQGHAQLVLRWDGLATLATALVDAQGRRRLAQPWQLLGNVCTLMDQMLQVLLQRLAPRGHVLLVCAGTLPAALRPDAHGALDSVPPGLMLMAGPGVAGDALHLGGSLLDVAPTWLSLNGLPPLPGAAGRSWHVAPPRAPDPAAPSRQDGPDQSAPPPRWLHVADLPVPASDEPQASAWLRQQALEQGLPWPDLAPLRELAQQVHVRQLVQLAQSLQAGGPAQAQAAHQALHHAMALAPQAAAPAWLALQWAVSQGDAAQAAACLTGSPVLQQVLSQADAQAAVLACARQDWAAAEPALRRLAGLSDWPINLHAWHARALLGLGRLADAQVVLQQAATSPFERLPTALLQSQVHLGLGQAAAAQAAARRAISLAPGDGQGHAQLAEAFVAGGDLAAGIAAQWRACTLAPHRADWRSRWAEWLRQSAA